MKAPVRVAVVFVLLMTAGLAVQGQTRSTESSCLVMYDPVFWKTKLRLREDQCRSIREVNAQYYERLVAVLDKPASSKVSTLTLVEQYLSDRNEKIWNIFQPVQRKRWKRLWDHQYAVNAVHSERFTDHGHFGQASSRVALYPATVLTVDRGQWTVDRLIHRQL